MENLGNDPGTSHMLSERSTTWANSAYDYTLRIFSKTCQNMANMRLAKTHISVGIQPTIKVFCVDKWQRGWSACQIFLSQKMICVLNSGESRYQSWYLSRAKRALYHLS